MDPILDYEELGAAKGYITNVLSKLGAVAAERLELREARKVRAQEIYQSNRQHVYTTQPISAVQRLHPPGSVPPLEEDDPLNYKATQIMNKDDAEVLAGFPVSHSYIVYTIMPALDRSLSDCRYHLG